jgi:Concanavalin A-like lectin/glucanases superfamily
MRGGVRLFGMRKRRLRTFAAGIATVGLLTALPVAAGGLGEASATATGAGSGEQSASERAVASGEPVEVVADRTEFTTTYANPDGATYTLRQSAVPVRVKTAGGGWTAPDVTLAHRTDGSVGPVAAMADVTFSGGGSTAPLVTIGSQGQSISLSWPGVLPVPVLDGASAVYSDVLPGVDLRMTATVGGYRELLVVKTPTAAADPAVARIEFGLDSAGVTVTRTAGGGMAGVDDNGRQVFTAPAAQMWDSRGTGGETTAKAGTAKAVQSLADTTSSADALDGPAPGAGTATVPIDVGVDTLAVEPDPVLLAQTDAAAFPLYIDPDVELNSSASEHTLLRSDGLSDYNWDNTASDGTPSGKGDGKCGTWNGYYCGPGYVQRLYYQFTPSALVGKQVLSAYFTVTSQWAFQCQDRVSDLVRTNNFSAGTTWASRPRELDWMVDKSFSAGRGSSCDPDSPAAPIEFADNSAEPDENLTPTVRDFAAGKFAKLTLELRAHDEGDASAWKRFKNDGTLVVTYIGTPLPPSDTGIHTGSSVTCETDSANPDVVTESQPIMAARVRVAAGGSPADNPARLRARLLVQQKYPSGTWGEVEDFVRPKVPNFAADKALVEDISPAVLSDGVLYRMAAFTWSYKDDTTHIDSHSTVTTAGDWCYFRVDSTGPKEPKVTFNGPYTLCVTNYCPPEESPGVPGSFTFSPAAGDTNIAAYQYRLSSSAWVDVALDGGAQTKTLSITPHVAGEQQLHVRAMDVYHRWGATAKVPLKVGEGTEAVGQWHFDDTASGGTSATAADTGTGPGSRHQVTLYTDGAGWSIMGRRGDGDRSLWLNDSSSPTQQAGYAATQAPVVDTRSSFTVSSWVYLHDTTQYRTVMSETGSDNSGFTLRYSSGVHQWVFLWSWDSGGTRQAVGVNSTVAVVPVKVWTHLAVSYDAGTRTLLLYVNGKRASEPLVLSAAQAVQTADGPLQFGRASYTSGATFTDYWRGRLDEVEIWQRALSGDEIALYSRLLDPASGAPAVENVVNWDAAGALGTTVTDATTGYGHVLTTTGTNQLDGEALVLKGANAATTPGPVIDESGSFSVTALVQPDNDAMLAKPDGYIAQVVGQHSADGSAWGLWYQKTGSTTTLNDNYDEITVPASRWLFGRVTSAGVFLGSASDLQGTSGDTGDGSDSGGAVRITGAYDALSGKATLYMNASNQDSQAFTAVWGSGDLSVGGPGPAVEWDHYLSGRVQEIRIWSGAVANSSQVSTVVGG